MGLLKYLTVLLFIGAVQPAPRSPLVVQARDHGGRYQPPAWDAWPSIPEEEEEEQGAIIPRDEQHQPGFGSGSQPVQRKCGHSGSCDDSDEDGSIVRELENRLMRDLNQTEQELLLIHILLGHNINTLYQRPHYFNPGSFPGFTPSDTYPDHVSEDDIWDDDYSVGDPHDDTMFGFPGFGFDQPAHFSPDLPIFPSWFNLSVVDDLPDNYDNSTHEVHVVNGTRIEVNKTTNKEAGDGFNSFFHHEVIHIRPDQDTKDQVPDDQDTEDQVPDDQDTEDQFPVDQDPHITVIPEWEEDVSGEDTDLERTEAPPEEEELPFVPDVENEVASSGDAPVYKPSGINLVPAQQVAAGEDSKDGSELKVLTRSKKAAYISKHVKDDDAEVDEDEPPPPDLSGDTLVNHVTSDHQGIVQVDPDAEIFDLNLVLEEARPKDDDK